MRANWLTCCAVPAVPIQCCFTVTLSGTEHLPTDHFHPCSMQTNSTMCSGAALTRPLAQQQTHQLFQLLELASFSPLPVAAKVQPATECAAVLGYLQLSIGLVLPLLAQAALESSLFQEHQQQRRQCGVRPESGYMQWVFDAIGSLGEALDRVTFPAALWMLLGLLWKLSVVIAYRQAEGS